MYIYTYTYTRIYMHIYVCIYSKIEKEHHQKTVMTGYTRTNIHMHVYTYAHSDMEQEYLLCIHAENRVPAHTHTHVCTDTYPPAHTHTHVCTDTYPDTEKENLLKTVTGFLEKRCNNSSIAFHTCISGGEREGGGQGGKVG